MALSISLGGACFVVITGASQGIGRSLAVECSRLLGPNSVMLLLARNLQGLDITKSLAETTNVKILVHSVDLSDITPSSMEALLTNVLVGYDLNIFDLNMIIHNVGSIGDLSKSASELNNVEVWRKYYDLNVFHVATLNSVFLKIFKGREDKTSVVNITSLCGIQAFAGMPLYCSGKAAREMYFKVLAEEFPRLKVLNYSPGPVETDMVQGIMDNTPNAGLKDIFVSCKRDNKLLQPDQTVKRFLDVLCKGNYKSGEHVDYFDE